MSLKKFVTIIVVTLATFGALVVGRKIVKKVKEVKANIDKNKEQEDPTCV